ncbi:MAG: hypothetical protein GX220_01050 [Treponema sp.]|nr:hypothetical protein [Treponema sp.]
MDFSATNNELWNPIVQFGTIAALILLSNVIRLKVPFVKKTLMPTAVLAGFILLLLKSKNIVKMDSAFLDMLTYHGIALGFIAMSLRIQKQTGSKKVARVATKSGALIVSTYMVQAVVGLSITLFLAFTFMPNLFKASGILLPMGFGQGPGQANNVGSAYESLGFVGGKSFGLAIAAMGYLVACVVGVIYLNILIRKKKYERSDKSEIFGSVTIDTFQDDGEIPIASSIDKFSIQCALVLLVYLISFLILKAISFLLEKYLPGVASTVVPLLWGFNFIFGSLFAILVRFIISRLRKTKVMNRQYQNNYLLSRISGFAFDIMIIAGIASIDFGDITHLWIPFVLMSIFGTIITFIYLKFMCNKIYPEYSEEGFVSMFGMLTGTISSGILLVREIDSEFKTPAANNLVSGSGTGIAFGAPVLILIGLAPKSTTMTFMVLGLATVYLVILMSIIFALNKKDY